jgi:hypothetical protein
MGSASGEKGKIFVKYATIIYFCPAAEAEGAMVEKLVPSADWRIN